MSPPAPPLLIIGQGLAGSALGWGCERAGVPFRIVDAGHATAASRVGAGIINPLTGRRLALTWRIDEWRDGALQFYRELERVLGLPLVTELRIRRRYRAGPDPARRGARPAEGAVVRWREAEDEAGLWIRGGAQVETARLIAALRQRWLQRGWLVEGREREPSLTPARVIWCVGAAEAPAFEWLPWERSQGEILQGILPGLTPGVLLNEGHWVLPGPTDQARVGATYVRDVTVAQPTAAGRAELLAAAQRLTGAEMTVRSHEAALRITTPDRRPVIGWHPRRPGCGIFGGLGSKGVVWAPALAHQWVRLLQEGGAVDPEVDVARFR